MTTHLNVNSCVVDTWDSYFAQDINSYLPQCPTIHHIVPKPHKDCHCHCMPCGPNRTPAPPTTPWTVVKRNEWETFNDNKKQCNCHKHCDEKYAERHSCNCYESSEDDEIEKDIQIV